MPTNRQIKFVQQVAQAARDARRALPRGRPVLENLTVAGRKAGLKAMRLAPCCSAKRKDGQPCRAKALKGAKRCVKHGGRAEVPGHAHNIRRFLTGELQDAIAKQDRFMEGKQAWDALSRSEQRELLYSLPHPIAANSRDLFAAARLIKLRDSRRITFSAFRRQWGLLLKS